jgi:hypothetical protein
MTKISSGYTALHKILFPLIWFGFIAFFIIAVLTSDAPEADPMLLVIPVALAVFGYFFFKHLLWDLADEVFDCGDYLLVRNRGAEEKVPLTNILNVNATTLMNPPRITLRLVEPGRLGAEVTFSPARGISLNPFARDAVAEDLMVRVHRAKVRNAV